MKITFKDEALSELYETGKTKDRKYKQLCKNKKLVDGYIRAVSIMYRTETTRELREYSFLHYERLAHDPCSSIRIVNGKVERLLFTETEDGVEVELIEIDSTHYGNKKSKVSSSKGYPSWRSPARGVAGTRYQTKRFCTNDRCSADTPK